MTHHIARRSFIAGALLLAAGAASAQTAPAGHAKFTEAAFSAAQNAGKPILIEVSAPWCPVCKVQGPAIKDLAQQAELKNFVVFEIDFDSQKDLLAKFKVTKQSTLIVFKGKTETQRSVGETKLDAIERQMRTAI